MSIHNPEKGVSVIPATTGGVDVVGDTLATGLVSSKLSIRMADYFEAFVTITTVGNLTDLRIQPYISTKKEPIAFTAGGNADWAPLSAETVAAGLADHDLYEAKFDKATWFSTDGKSCIARFPATGAWVILVLYDAAGDGSSSSVAANIFIRK